MIHPTAIIEDGAQLGARVQIGPYSHVGAKVVLHDDVVLKSHVVLDGNTEIGARTEIASFASLGGPPQHLGYKGEDTKLIIGTDNSIREYVTMNPGTVAGIGETRVGNHGLFMAGIHVAHDCVVGDHVVMANTATLGGHVCVQDYVFMGGKSGVHQFCRVGIYSFIGAAALVTTDVIPYGSVFGNHASLEGLNIVGMKRRGTPRPVIHDIRAAYRLLFADEGTFQERVDDVATTFSTRDEVMMIINFIKAGATRRLCMPKG